MSGRLLKLIEVVKEINSKIGYFTISVAMTLPVVYRENGADGDSFNGLVRLD